MDSVFVPGARVFFIENPEVTGTVTKIVDDKDGVLIGYMVKRDNDGRTIECKPNKIALKFRVGARVKGKSGTDDANKTGIIIEKGQWINARGKPVKPPSDVWFVLWDGETEKTLKIDNDLEIIN